jgi:SAM-dependent methyltransferase
MSTSPDYLRRRDVPGIIRTVTDERSLPLMYRDLAAWFPLITPVEDYREESAFIASLFDRAQIPVIEILELGSGGGHVASFLRDRFSMTLVDLSDEMLELSRELNLGCEHIEGDMRTIRLGRKYDGVLIHDAIMYMTTEADLRAAMETAHTHCRRGGMVVIAPDFTRELFEPDTTHEGVDDATGRGVRYLEWAWDPDESDTTVRVDYVYALRDETGNVEVRHDPHEVGLFPRDTWLGLLESVGFSTDSVIDPDGREIFLGFRPR